MIPHPSAQPRLTFLAALCAFALGGCAVGPSYERPSAATPAVYKEAKDWAPAMPSDALDRGPWWTLFDDPALNALETQVDISNQNVAAAAASYDQARAVVREQRASLFPVVNLNAGDTKSGGAASTRKGSSYQASIGGSWEPDVWGKLRRGVDSAAAGAQISAADLASAKLSAQGELAVNYFSLRQTDAQQSLLNTTIEGYQRSQQIAQNRYTAGIAAKADVLQAQTQLANAQAEALGLVRQRAQFEHAIAVLLGRAPSDFSMAIAPWKALVPPVPAGVPSTLLERRPDIAAAERQVAIANNQIGIAKSAYYPGFNLSASYSSSADRVGDLFKASTSLWSLGLSAAQVVFNAGATGARVDGAKAAHEASVARYRQTVLAAFQDVEDQLAATRVLAQQEDLKRQASQAADEAEVQVLNRYKAGQVAYSEVVASQASALSARRALVQLQADRQTAAVALIQALGGGWHAEAGQ